MASQGPNSAGSGADDGGGFVAWASPGSITASDDVYASAAILLASSLSNFLLATSFGFSIPSGAVIDGIKVEIERSDIAGPGSITDASVKLLKGGSPVGSDYASGTTWPAGDAYEVYGGASDLWGTTWSVADINASNFGVTIQVQTNISGASTAAIDHIRITVYYTDAATPGVATVTATGVAPTASGSGTGTATASSAATVTATGVAPAASGTGTATASPGAADIVVTAEPTDAVIGTATVNPGTATVTISGVSPTATVLTTQSASPGTATVTVSGAAPTPTGSGTGTATPGTATVTISGEEPAHEGTGIWPIVITLREDRLWQFNWTATDAEYYRVVLYGHELARVTENEFVYTLPGWEQFPPFLEIIEGGT